MSSPFEIFVNQELPLRVGSGDDPVTVTEGKVAVTTGRGLQVTFQDVNDVLGSAKSAYDLAVENGFVGTIEEWLESLKGEDGVIGVDGKSAYENAVEAGFEGTEEEFGESLIKGGDGLSGGVFITDVTPVDPTTSTGNKEMSEDGYSLVEFTTTTEVLEVHVTAITGHSNYRPNVTVNDVPVELTAKEDAPLWTGTVEIEVEADVDGKFYIKAEHEDGAKAETSGEMESRPEIIETAFVSGYPLGQTELKENDEMDILVIADEEVIRYEIEDFGAFKAASGDFPQPGEEFTIENLKVADRGTDTQVLGYKIRVQKASGAWSEWFESNQYNQEELISEVALNNTKPVITVTKIEYPVAQFGIKAGDSVFIEHTVTDADTYTYTSPNGNLDIESPTLFETRKEASYLAGDYNDSVQNFALNVRRNANGATAEYKTIIQISNVVPTASISVPAVRLRSGGNHGTVVQKHRVTITANQALSQDPVLNVPEGNWDSSPWQPNANRKVWTRNLLVHDDDAKGDFTFNSLTLVNGAALEGNTITSGEDYTLGGFVFRTLTVDAYPNREADIGTMVANVDKLRCTNLSKGDTGTLNFTYKDNKVNEVDKYTILNDNTWYNCDAPNSTSNTSGLMKIELEEVV